MWLCETKIALFALRFTPYSTDLTKAPGPGSIWNWFSPNCRMMPPEDLTCLPMTNESPPVPRKTIADDIFIPQRIVNYLNLIKFMVF
jgi:hypothetical protein